MTNLKDLRDKINTCKDEDQKAELQEEWNRLHQEMEDLKWLDERNYVEFERCQHDWSTTVHVSGTFGGPVNRRTSKQCKLCGVVG